jgi:hypothetical protein
MTTCHSETNNQQEKHAMTDKQAWADLERFAAAMGRGATVVFGNGDRRPKATFTGRGMSADLIANMGGIREIIEPKKRRTWNAEDAKRHVGFAFRGGPGKVYPKMIGHDGNFGAWEDDFYARLNWVGFEYAAPVWGTDPATWNWQPCEVEE